MSGGTKDSSSKGNNNMVGVVGLCIGLSGVGYLVGGAIPLTVELGLYMALYAAIITQWASAASSEQSRTIILAALAVQLLVVGITSPLGLPNLIFGCGVIGGMYYLLCLNKVISQKWSSLKTVVLDWLVLFPAILVAAYYDLFHNTTHFYYILGYGCGTIFCGLPIVKASEYLWSKSDTPRNSDLKKAVTEGMFFVHLSYLSKKFWTKLHAKQLVLVVLLAGFLIYGLLLRSGGTWDDWHLYFLLGAVLCVASYFGPIAAGATLSAAEVSAVKDSDN